MAQKKRRRGSAGRSQKTTVLIYCQGTVTEVQYFNALKEYLKVSEFSVKGQKISRAPVKTAQEGVQEARKGQYDEVFIVVDVDDFQDLAEAERVCRNATNKNLEAHLVVSNPCFELWLLLLFKPRFESSLHRNDIQAMVKREGILGGKGDKHLMNLDVDDSWFGASVPGARIADLNAMGKNPSTAVPHLIQRMQRSSRRS